MGIKLSETSDLIFDEVRVPEDHVIGEVGKGFTKGLDVINWDGRALGVSYNVGLVQAALDKATEYTACLIISRGAFMRTCTMRQLFKQIFLDFPCCRPGEIRYKFHNARHLKFG